MSSPLSPHTCDETPIGLLKRFMGLEETSCPECRRRRARIERTLKAKKES